MNYKVFNEDNLDDKDMNGVVTRVKAFVINSRNEIIVASSNGGVQLIGGHVEDGEEEIETLKREILEESGMEISNDEISDCFYEVRHYIKDYFHSGKNIVAVIHYYIVKTAKEPNLNKVHLTAQEKGYSFELKQIPIDSFEEYISGFLNNEKEINRIIASETIEAFKNMP